MAERLFFLSLQIFERVFLRSLRKSFAGEEDLGLTLFIKRLRSLRRRGRGRERLNNRGNPTGRSLRKPRLRLRGFNNTAERLACLRCFLDLKMRILG